MTSGVRAADGRGDMLFLLFRIGADRYALAADDVGEVLPMIDIKALPGSPPAVAGLIDYRGLAVPVIDLNGLALGRSARPRLSTRILLCRYDEGHMLGLIAEQATDMVRRPAADFQSSGVRDDGRRWLGPVAADPGGLIQWVDPSRLLSAEIRKLLFQPESAA